MYLPKKKSKIKKLGEFYEYNNINSKTKTTQLVWFNSNRTGVTSGAGIAYSPVITKLIILILETRMDVLHFNACEICHTENMLHGKYDPSKIGNHFFYKPNYSHEVKLSW
jgi:hypothetical protein